MAAERVLDLLSERIELMAEIGRALSTEQDPMRLQEQILFGAKRLTNADGGTLYGLAADGRSLNFRIMATDSLGIHLGGSSGAFIDLPPVPLYHADGRPNTSSVVAYSVLKRQTVNIADAYAEPGFDFAATRSFDARTRYRSRSMLTVPLRNHERQIVGVLQLLNARVGAEAADPSTVVPFSPLAQKLAEALASQAAVALTRQELIEGMQRLFEGFVKLIADSIDRKSPYTGGHCRRVTELTLLLAEATSRTAVGPFAGFAMSEADRYELNIAGLLHDCGKLTTPDWVLDKSSKLHGLYDRIEVVLGRLLVVRREAELALLRAGDTPSCRAEFVTLCDELDDEADFLRRINRGAEAMATADQERVRRIAARTWRDAQGTERPLLDADEVAALCVVRGTLTDAERQVVQDHVVATIQMLGALPYPSHLARVPEFAGGHHEFIDGTGYPRKLTREQMSPQARMMAIADIFEALTAADRPYKQPMPLSQALRILGQLAQAGRIDPDLFAIFISQGVWREYAQKFLRPEQVDAVDVAALPGYSG